MTARTRFLGAAFALGLLASPASRLFNRAFGAASDPTGCANALQETVNEWHGTGQWRSLAPYPTPREASPTQTVGVWLERAHLERGTTELRRISEQQTDIASFGAAGCSLGVRTIHRTFNRDSNAYAFDDAALDSLISANGRGMIYVWSPRMPLSVQGLSEARAAAEKLGISFTAVAAEANDDELRASQFLRADKQRFESVELVYRNATVHYPSVVLYHDSHIVDGAFLGYKDRDTYLRYAREKFSETDFATIDRSSQKSENSAAFWVDHNARVTAISAVNTPRRIGFFFKPISGTTLVSYNARNVDYFFDMATGKELRVPGHIDPVPTPDGRFLTLPGLYLHPISSLLAGDQTPAFVDPELPDEYQTASILSETKTGVRYRIVTGWNAGARFRDYDVAFDKSGKATSITTAGDRFAPCKDRLLTLPINAKSGKEFGAFDTRTQTNMIFEVADSTHCIVKLDLGFASGKLSFSHDGTAIAFATSLVNTDTEGELIRPSELFHKDALVLVRKTGRIISLSQNASISGMTFPEFQKNGTVMILDQFGPGRPIEQLRVVAWK